MSPSERRLFRQLLELGRHAMTSSGHLAQLIPWESRGVCAARPACSPSCVAAQRTLKEAGELLAEDEPRTLRMEL